MAEAAQSQSVTLKQINDYCQEKYGRALYSNARRCGWPCGVTQNKKGTWTTKQCSRKPSIGQLCTLHHNLVTEHYDGTAT